METILLITVVVLCAAIIAVLFWNRRRPSEDPASLLLMQQQLQTLQGELARSLEGNSQLVNQQIASFQNQIAQSLQNQSAVLQTTNQSISTRMDTTTQSMNQRLDAAARVIGEVKNELGRVSMTMKAVSEIQDILKAPKLRGGFGEIFLGDLLEQILPKRYMLQHRFTNGTAVDAVVMLGDKLVPVDSKFPLENFNKGINAETEELKKIARRQFMTDVKKHIDAVEKYIIPDENTYEFALMYIPSENIYYEIAVKNEWGSEDKPLVEYAMRKKVIPVSPNTLYVYLYTISLGLRGLAVEKNAQVVIDRMMRLQKELTRFQDEFALVGRHLTNASAAYVKTDKRLGVISERMKVFGPEDSSEESIDTDRALEYTPPPALGPGQ
jgi:DNA recombination protein RmuC